MFGITDEKGISLGKLKHVFLGTVHGQNVSGYHCDQKYGDEAVFALTHYYPNSNKVITANRKQKIYEAVVIDKQNHITKACNHGKSTFFREDWCRQDVVDCIDRLSNSGHLIKQYKALNTVHSHQIYVDKQTGLVVVNNAASTYPLLRY